jgi:hypothetical protein
MRRVKVPDSGGPGILRSLPWSIPSPALLRAKTRRSTGDDPNPMRRLASKVGVRIVSRVALALVGLAAVVSLLTAVASPARAQPAIGAADDALLVYGAGGADQVLDGMAAHRVTFVRTIAYYGQPLDPWVVAAQRARTHGLAMRTSLALPWGEPQIDVTPRAFAAWAGRAARALANTGVDLRISVLNEPDLLIAAGDGCGTTTAVDRAIASAGYRKARRWVIKTKTVRKVVRRHGRRVVVKRKVRVYRIVRVAVWRHGRRIVVRRRRPVMVRRTFIVPTTYSLSPTTLTAQRGCLAVMRARRAVALWNAAIPAIRRTSPGVSIDIGETSPAAGVEPFIAAVGRLGVPRVDGWAHHPYFMGPGPGLLGAERLDALRAAVTAAIGDVPLDLTEFGIPVRGHRHVITPETPERAAELWRSAYHRACTIGARELVAYQWAPTPAGSESPWDTGILSDDGGESPASTQLASLAC